MPAAREKVFPTVIFGAGGTGSRVVNRVQKMLLQNERYSFLSDRMFVFGVLDTNKTDLNKLSVPVENKVPLSKHIHSLRDLLENVEARDGKNARQQLRDEMGKWFGMESDLLYDHNLTQGAGQFRVISRAAWEGEMMIGGLGSRIDKVLEKVTHVELNQYKLGDSVEAYVVSSIAGGTGAGSSLMLARYIRKYFEERNIDCTVKGVLLLPEIFCHAPQGQAQWQRLRANGYAYLKELEGLNKRFSAINKNLDQLPLHYPDGNILPFDVAFLVDALGESGGLKYDGDYSSYERFAAQALFSRLFCKNVAESNLSAENNIINALLGGEAAANTLSRRYCSMGTSALVYPIEDTALLISKRAVADLVNDDWVRLDQSYLRALTHYRQETEMGNTNVKKPERYQHMLDTIGKEVERKEVGEHSSGFMISIHAEVVQKTDRGVDDQAKNFYDAVNELMRNRIKTVGKNHKGLKEIPGTDGMDNAYEGGKTGLANLLRRMQGELVEADGLIRNELATVAYQMMEDIIYSRDQSNSCSIYKYLQEKTLFGIRYLLSRVYRQLLVDSERAKRNYREAERKMQDLRNRKWALKDGSEATWEQFMAKEIPESLSGIDKTLKSKKFKTVTAFFEEFQAYYNDWVTARQEYAVWWLRDRVYGELIRFLGEDVRDGGLLGVIYSVTGDLIEDTGKIIEQFERDADTSVNTDNQFENITKVYGDKAARMEQLQEVKQELQSDIPFKKKLYRKLCEQLLGEWFELRRLEKDPHREHEYKRKQSRLHRDAYKAVSEGMENEAYQRVKDFSCIDLDIVSACRREARLRGNGDAWKINEYIKDLLGTLEKNADVMIKLTAKQDLQSLNYVVFKEEDGTDDVEDGTDDVEDGRTGKQLKEYAATLSNESSTVNDGSFGSHALVFSRSVLCYNLRQVVGLTATETSAQRAYYDTVRAGEVTTHIDSRFGRILEDFDPRLLEDMALDLGLALVAGLIEDRDGVFWFQENGMWDSLDAVGYYELRQAFQEQYMNRFKLMVDKWRSALEAQDQRRLQQEQELPALVQRYLEQQIVLADYTAADREVIKEIRNTLSEWLKERN